MANYPQELAQDAVCQSHTGHMTGSWFLPARPLRLNSNEWMNGRGWVSGSFLMLKATATTLEPLDQFADNLLQHNTVCMLHWHPSVHFATWYTFSPWKRMAHCSLLPHSRYLAVAKGDTYDHCSLRKTPPLCLHLNKPHLLNCPHVCATCFGLYLGHLQLRQYKNVYRQIQ